MSVTSPRERVALGVAAATLGVIALVLSETTLVAFVGGLLIGGGLTVVAFALLRLWIQGRDDAYFRNGE